MTSQPEQPPPVPINTLSVPMSTVQLVQCTSSAHHMPVTVSQPGLESDPCHPAPAPTPVIDVNGMHTLINFLDRLITHRNVQVTAPVPASPRQFSTGPFQRRNCHVCGDTSHSTLMHCRQENLCLSCFALEHWKRDCNRRRQNEMRQSNARVSLWETRTPTLGEGQCGKWTRNPQ